MHSRLPPLAEVRSMMSAYAHIDDVKMVSTKNLLDVNVSGSMWSCAVQKTRSVPSPTNSTTGSMTRSEASSACIQYTNASKNRVPISRQ